jgi:hypothetical protein
MIRVATLGAVALLAAGLIPTASSAVDCLSADQMGPQGPYTGQIYALPGHLVMATLGDFTDANGATGRGDPQLVPAPDVCMNAKTLLSLNATNLQVLLGGSSDFVTIEFCDGGGYSNLTAKPNGFDFGGKIGDANGAKLSGVLGDVTVGISAGPSSAWSLEGKIALEGPSQYFAIGGEELYIANICFY